MKSLSFYSIIFALVLFMAACNGEEEPAAPAEEPIDDGVRTIELIGTDDMKFRVAEEADGLVIREQIGDEYEVDQILAEPGETLRIVLTTRSELPPTAMSHNFALLHMGVDVDAFANASAVAADNEYIAPDMEDQVYVTTSMLGGGETETIEFDAPEEPGEYEFVCTFPGHFVAGMRGTLVVQ